MDLNEMVLKCIDCIFPPSPSTLRVRHAHRDAVIERYVLRLTDGINTLSDYDTPLIRALIQEAKFHANTRAFLLLNTLFCTYVASCKKHFNYIIPIPLSPTRMRTRGYNQVTEILRATKSSPVIPIETAVLKRIRDTRPQTELNRTERLLNVDDAFGVAHGERITGKHILLIDDVMTTGATLKAAKASLLPHAPASVTMLAFAH